jgi:hypothetical protein
MLQHYQKMAELGLPQVMKSNVPDYGVVRFFFILWLWQKMYEFLNEIHCNFIYMAFYICLTECQCVNFQIFISSECAIFSLVGAFAKVGKAMIGFVMSVFPPVSPFIHLSASNNLAPTLQILMKYDI